MACHSNPSVAPKDLVDRYGDSAGFYEQEGDMRAILSTYYPMSDELFSSQKSFIKVSIGIFFVFAILLGVIYYILKQFEIKNKKLQLLNQSLDDEVGERTQELLNEKIFLKNILDISPNLIIVIDKHKIYKANETFYKFFGIEKAEEFEDKYGMLCSHFSLVDKTFSYEDRPHNPDDWYSFFIEHHNEEHTISLTKGDKKHYFNISASVLKQDQFVMNLRDITLLREKENIIIQQTKMESMGEMLTNIAHQWRQPLSMISTVATGVIAQKEIGILTDEKLIKSLDSINQSTQNMSNIIDEFSSFYQVQKDMSYIKNIKLIEKTLKLADNNLKKSVKIVLDIQEATIYGLENEIIQVVLNMLNNAKEILFHRDIEKKIIKISSFETQDAVLISVHDSGNGIPEDIKQKVFEPYFTTKHQKQGVGIGLYMSYEIISFYMDGDITVENDMFDDGDDKYFGAKFTISIPKKK